jgi:hypothetical protein
VAWGSTRPTRIRLRAAQVAMSRWLPQTHAMSTPVTGVREATGYCPGCQSAVDTGMAIDTSLARCAGHQPSGERSLERPFRKQRTVNQLIVPCPGG